MGVVAILPTRQAVDDAWERYAALMRPIVDDPALLLDRPFSEELAIAWADWRDLWVVWIRRCS